MIKLSGYGRREWLGTGVVAFALVVGCGLIAALLNSHVGIFLGLLVVFVWCCLAAFFRDPERSVPKDPEAICSPADGVIRDIELIRGEGEEFHEHFKGEDMVRIGIFLSVFDVHINRAPCEMSVSFRNYKKGCFHDARDGRASKENESLALGGIGRIGDFHFPLVVRQISGAIARRIVCEAQAGTELKRGERYGMIKFGSRTELFLPAGTEFELEVKVGDRVSAGSSMLAKLSKEGTPAEFGTDTKTFVEQKP